MNSHLLKTHLPVESLFCLPFIFVIVVVFRVFFIPVFLSHPFYLFLLIKTYKVSSCVSLAPAI